MSRQVFVGAGLLLLGVLAGCAGSAPSESESLGSTSEAVTAPVPLGCDTAACCPAGTAPLALSGNADTLNNSTPKQCIVAGAGSDTIFSSGLNSAILGGDGDDTIMAGVGAQVRGGAGRDTINGFTSGTVYGGYGDDVIFSGNGNNFVYPGPGLDTVSCGTGNDTVAIYDLCELTAGEQLVGGTGNNTLITPVPLAQLQARGVSVTGFQNIVVKQNSCKSECVAGNECSGRGTCIEGSSTGQIKCDCPIGYSGKQCEIVGEPQLPPTVPNSIKTPIPGYDPGSLACAPSLEFDNVNAPGFARKVLYRPNPAPGCEAKFCSSSGPGVPETAVAKPTEAQLNAPVAQSSTCSATPAKTGKDCMVLPGSAQNTCFSDAECSTGLICARVCQGPLCTTSERRCGKPADSCKGQPAESYCDDPGFRMCADEQPGTSTKADYLTALAPSPGLPSGHQTVPDPLQPLSRLEAFGRCGPVPSKPSKAVGQDSPWQKKEDGSSQFGVYMRPQLNHSAKFTPIGVGETKFAVNVLANLTSGVKLFGKSFNAIVADAHASLENCKRDVAATVTVFGDELVTTPGAAVNPALTDGCNTALSAWAGALDEVQIANAQARQAVNLYKKTGPSEPFCTQVKTALVEQEKPAAKKALQTALKSEQLNCQDPAQLALSARLATNAIVEHYRNVRQQSEAAFATFNQLRSVYAGGQSFALKEGKPFSVVGGEASFPIGPVTLTIAGDLYGDWGLQGFFGYTYQVGTSPSIGGTAEIGPFVNLDASIFAGVGIPGVSIGIEGTLRLIGVRASANVGMTLQGQLGADPRPIGDWAGDALPGFPSKITTWNAPWEYGAFLHIDSLSGHFDLAARVNFFFFKHTFRKQLFAWNGFSQDFDLTPGGVAATQRQASNFGQFGDAQVITEVAFVTPATPISDPPSPTTSITIDLPGEKCNIVK